MTNSNPVSRTIVAVVVLTVLGGLLTVGGVAAQDDGTPTADNETTPTDGETPVGDETPADEATPTDGAAQPGDETNATDGEVRVRVFHAAVDAPAVDVYVNDEPVAENLSYGNVSEYASVGADGLDVRVTAAGDENRTLTSTTVPLQPGTYTVFAIGSAARNGTADGPTGPTQAGNDTGMPEMGGVQENETETPGMGGIQENETGTPETGGIQENETETPEMGGAGGRPGNETAGQARAVRLGVAREDGSGPAGDGLIRAAQLSPDTGAVDVIVDGVDLPLVETVPYANASDYVNLPPGDYTFEFRRPSNGTSGQLLTTANVSVSADSARTMWLIGRSGGNGSLNESLQVVVTDDVLADSGTGPAANESGEATPTEPGAETPTESGEATPTEPGDGTPTETGEATPGEPGEPTPTEPGPTTPTETPLPT